MGGEHVFFILFYFLFVFPLVLRSAAGALRREKGEKKRCYYRLYILKIRGLWGERMASGCVSPLHAVSDRHREPSHAASAHAADRSIAPPPHDASCIYFRFPPLTLSCFATSSMVYPVEAVTARVAVVPSKVPLVALEAVAPLRDPVVTAGIVWLSPRLLHVRRVVTCVTRAT